MTSPHHLTGNNRNLNTSLFHQHPPAEPTEANGNKIDPKANYNSELDLTRQHSLRSIFMTDASKNLQMHPESPAHDLKNVSVDLRLESKTFLFSLSKREVFCQLIACLCSRLFFCLSDLQPLTHRQEIAKETTLVSINVSVISVPRWVAIEFKNILWSDETRSKTDTDKRRLFSFSQRDTLRLIAIFQFHLLLSPHCLKMTMSSRIPPSTFLILMFHFYLFLVNCDDERVQRGTRLSFFCEWGIKRVPSTKNTFQVKILMNKKFSRGISSQ